MTYKPIHFYVVFNPMLGYQNPDYPTQAHEFYERLKMQWQEGRNEPYLYWGKIKKTKNNVPLDLNVFSKAIDENNKNKCDTHLYISDFNNLWVAKVEAVTSKIDSIYNTLEIYNKEDVEIWFKISEIDLIYSNSKDTIDFLSCLSTKDISSINPFLGGLRYPLIVNDNLGEKYFCKGDGLKSRMLVENLDITNSAERIKELIINYAIPERNFSRLSSVIKNEILAIELEFQEMKKVNGLKTNLINKIACTYIQILEGVLNSTFVNSFKSEENINHIKNYKRENPNEKIGSQFYEGRNLSLHEIEFIISNDTYANCIGVKKHLKNLDKSDFGKYLRSDLLEILNIKFGDGFALKDIRNDKVHLAGKINLSFNEAMEIRNLILGVGCTGIINEVIEKWNENGDQVGLKAVA